MGMRFKNPRVGQLENSVSEAICTKLSDEEAFKLVPFDENAVERTGYSNYSYWRSTFRAFRKNTLAMALVCIVLGILIFTFIQPYLPNQLDSFQSNIDPKSGAIFRNLEPGTEVTLENGKLFKFILGTILQEKYQTLITPSSFNTPMGVTKIIRERLTPATQVFVAEMGARHVGDIKELCRLVHPRYGVLTSVGPQHLDTFHTLERIKNTKYELMDAVPADGCCFFPDDGAICRELYDRTEKEKRLCCLHYSPDADVWATDVTVSPMGSRFVLHTSAEEIACETRLLGEHNIQNILLAATVALHLGLTMRQVARGISKLQPVEHRLQLIPSPGITIIDDAFNSNPKGAEAAVKVLGAFQARRIIITPGMVELGGQEAAFNREFGRKICGNADIAILVGKKHTQPIAEGLLAAGFPQGNLHVVASLDEATALLRQIGRPGDIAMFENDLPDHYSET